MTGYKLHIVVATCMINRSPKLTTTATVLTFFFRNEPLHILPIGLSGVSTTLQTRAAARSVRQVS